jgi:hypothetical protein
MTYFYCIFVSLSVGFIIGLLVGKKNATRITAAQQSAASIVQATSDAVKKL